MRTGAAKLANSGKIDPADRAGGGGRGRAVDASATGSDDAHAAHTDWFCAQILPHGPWLERWIARHFPREDDLADIVQESFEHVLGSADPVKVRNGRAYLRRTAYTLLLMRIRRRRVVHIDYRDSLDGLGLACAYPLQDAELSAREALIRATDALAALPERTRDIVRLRRWDGASQRETAATLGVSERTVEEHLRRATLAMRERVEGDG
ncbi:MAG TPA: RNA polymerase sigma factor [Sphingopyxis sp.]|nr:RNA polymerase sigma factor [Sphingopyxis sp.]